MLLLTDDEIEWGALFVVDSIALMVVVLVGVLFESICIFRLDCRMFVDSSSISLVFD